MRMATENLPRRRWSAHCDYVKLNVPERIQLVEDIWDSVAEIPEALSWTEAQQVELDRRLDAYRRNPEGVPWEYVKEAIRRGARP
jgi:putative addiction module component (TIGR02574 family)